MIASVADDTADGGAGTPPLLSDEWLDMDQFQFMDWLRDRPTVQSRCPGYPSSDGGHWACALYRYYDGEGALLYIGISTDICVRDRAHMQAWTKWRQSAGFILVEWYPSRRVAEAAEAQAIEDERPPGNRKWPAAYWSEFRSFHDEWWLKDRAGYRGDNPTWGIVATGGFHWSPRVIPCPFLTDDSGAFHPVPKGDAA